MNQKFALPEQFVAGGAAAPTTETAKAKKPQMKRTSAKSTEEKAPAGYPWVGEDPRIIRPFQLRLPADLHATLKFMGDTTAGQSMHSLILKAAFDLADSLKKARGIK